MNSIILGLHSLPLLLNGSVLGSVEGAFQDTKIYCYVRKYNKNQTGLIESVDKLRASLSLTQGQWPSV